MLFTEPIFVVFFAVVFAGRWSLRRHGWQKAFLLVANAVFYGAWDYRFLLLMGGYIVVNHYLAHDIASSEDPAERRRLIVATVVANLATLGFFKYFDFFASSGASLLTALGLRVTPTTLSIVLPVGISFITFQAMSYVIDVYRRELQPVSLVDFAVFKSFFPQLVAGPIVRASAFLPQLRVQQRLADVDFRRHLALFAVGYFKKACVADNVAGVIDPVFASPAAHGASDVLLASAGYSVQIYCDFSGYTDMAIACAGLLGFTLARNFDAPYLSGNVRDFWRRWHISLSSWLRDYLYVPLGGSRLGPARTHWNLIVTMTLGGLWHGANMTFVVWGLGHGLALSAHRLWSERPAAARLRALPGWGLFAWGATLAWVVLCFTLFRCESFGDFAALLGRVGEWQARAETPALLGWFMLGLLVLHAGVYARRAALQRVLRTAPLAAYGFALGVSVALLLFFTPVASAPFIYFQF